MSARRPEGISGWQALGVIAICVAMMTATFFIMPQ